MKTKQVTASLVSAHLFKKQILRHIFTLSTKQLKKPTMQEGHWPQNTVFVRDTVKARPNRHNISTQYIL